MKIKNIFRRSKEEKNTGQGVVTAFNFLPFRQSGGAMNLSTFFACTNLISNSISLLPLRISQKGKDKESYLRYHNIYDIFDDDNNTIDRFNLFKKIIEDVILYGNGYILIIRDDNGQPKKLRYLSNSNVIVNYNPIDDILYYTVTVLFDNQGVTKNIEPIDMLHFKLHTNDGVDGISLVSYAKKTINISSSQESSCLNYFENNGDIGGIINCQSNLNQKQINQIQQSFTNQTDGKRIAVLPLNMTYQPLQLNNEQAQFLQSRSFSVEDICRWFNVPPQLLQSQNITDIEALMNQFYFVCLLPYISMMEAQLKKLLMPSEKKQGLKIYFETNEILRASKTQQQQYYSGLINSGILSINEARNELGFNAIDGGDKHFIPFTDVSQNTINNKDEKQKENEDDKQKQ